MLTTLDIVAGLATLTLVAIIYARQLSSRKYPPLPGPPGLPIIGNLLDIPTPQNNAWKRYLEWGKKYNTDAVQFSALGMNIVVLNTVECCMELFEKRSSIYSDRPQLVMINELCSFSYGTAFLPYNDVWRDQRKAFHLEFHPTAVQKYRPPQIAAVNQFLCQMLDKPEGFLEHNRFFAGVIIMKVAYGIDVKDEDDPYIGIGEEGAAVISRTIQPGAFLVDVIPLLKYIPEWVPGATFKRLGREWSIAALNMLNTPFEAFKKFASSGDTIDCVANSLVESFGKELDDPEYREFIIKATLASMYAGGADTTVSALGTFFLAMTLFPEVQKKAQEEIDRVVGTGRLPNFSDQSSLPYVEAVIREVSRWDPVLPTGVPHQSTEDDYFMGCFIPKGTLVIPNSCGMLHNEQDYPDPFKFNPDRFLKEGKLNPSIRDPTTITFGFGRRICPGRYLAKESLWLAVSNVLATFEINKSIGEDGKPITPNGEYTRGLLCHPKPFPCTIKVRSSDHETLIKAALDS
ncbi:cytochrome P450 [Abortiporus biennis]|nr:cytochrome P450 [Abortiporus biennis]